MKNSHKRGKDITIKQYLRRIKFVENATSLVIGSLGFFINALYFTFESFDRQLWGAPVESALVLGTIPLYIAIGILYLHQTQATRKLEDSNRMKDMFIDIMRHDLFGPIGAINESNKLFFFDGEDENSELQTIIERNSEKVIDILKNASILAKLDEGGVLKFEEKNLKPLIERTIKDFIPLAEQKNINIVVENLQNTQAMVNPLIGNVFSNLLSNAVKYGLEGTDVKVHIKESDSNIVISFSNIGKNIPDKDKLAIFDRFNRVYKGPVEGTGLGLAIVKNIVKSHHGKVWVEDHPEGGSIFIISIPK